jgi:hypothetical protein
MASPHIIEPIEAPPGVSENLESSSTQAETFAVLDPETPKPKPSLLIKRQPEWEIRGLTDAFKDAEAPPYVIKDLVMNGTITLVSAQPHGMKSLSWLSACMEGVRTKKVFGHFEAPTLNNVLFIETEDPEWLVKKRIQGLAKGLKLPEGATLPGFFFTCPGPFELINQRKQLERLIEVHNLDLIVLSTLQNLLGGRSMKEQDQMADIMAMLVGVARKCPIVLLTHSPQDRSQKRAIGTITQGANCATHIHYEKATKGGDTFVHLSVDSKGGAGENDFSLLLLTDSKDSDHVRGVRGLTYAGKGNKGKTKEQKVREAIQQNPGASVAELVEIAGCDESHVRKTRKKMEKEKKEEGAS